MLNLDKIQNFSVRSVLIELIFGSIHVFDCLNKTEENI